MRFAVCSLFLLLAIGTLHECQGENIFRKLADDIKHAAEKFAHDVKHGFKDFGHDVKKGAKDVGHVAKEVGHDVKHVADKFGHDVKEAADDTAHVMKKFGNDVDKVVKTFRADISIAWIKARPYLKTAVVIVGGVAKTLAEIEEVAALFELLAVA